MATKKPAEAKALAPPFEEYVADPAAWARKLRRNLRRLENGALIEFAIERAVECEALRQFAAWKTREQAEAIGDVFLAHGPSEAEDLHDRARYTDLSPRGLLKAAKGKRDAKRTVPAREEKAKRPSDTKRAIERLRQRQRAGEDIWDRNIAIEVAEALQIEVRTVRNARMMNFPK